ncbi:hypothetical protein, partial [Leucobacter sp. M11]|uniref:hypothetical protein n=1 Tax=Leucobacter sp. M11 TaxID=2993565 RepID=UPI002D7FD949
TQTRRRLSLDFDRGVLLARGVAYPAAELRALVAATRTFPGTAQLLSFQFPTGAVDVQVSGFTPTAESRARNAALAAFVRQWLPIPEAAEVPQRTGLSLNHSAIGKQEALAILSR